MTHPSIIALLLDDRMMCVLMTMTTLPQSKQHNKVKKKKRERDNIT